METVETMFTHCLKTFRPFPLPMLLRNGMLPPVESFSHHPPLVQMVQFISAPMTATYMLSMAMELASGPSKLIIGSTPLQQLVPTEPSMSVRGIIKSMQ